MRLYVTPSGKWAGTQADAVRVARESDAGRWTQVEVPTDKRGLIAFLTDRNVVGASSENLELPAAPPPTSPDAGWDFTASEIEDFILNRATVAQVENIFAVLGTRFAERRAA